MSSALPCGIPSMMSVNTTFASPFSRSLCATPAPTKPAPTTVTFGVVIPPPPLQKYASKDLGRTFVTLGVFDADRRGTKVVGSFPKPPNNRFAHFPGSHRSGIIALCLQIVGDVPAFANDICNCLLQTICGLLLA